jgi:hypothetical protein
MPTEIADSDAESEAFADDVAAESNSEHNGTPQRTPLTGSQESPPKVDFDQFIDPTQRLSDLSPSQNPLLSKGTGSTEKILSGLGATHGGLAESSPNGINIDNGNASGHLDSSSPLNPRERGQSAIESGAMSAEEKPGKKKRAKTYSAKSRNGSFPQRLPQPSAGVISQRSRKRSRPVYGNCNGTTR